MSNDPTRAESLLEGARQKFGFVPNVLKEMSKSPATLECYLKGYDALGGSVLTEAERQVVMLTVSHLNECGYCRAAHKTIAKMSGVETETIHGIINNIDPPSERDLALVKATRLILEKRGFLSAQELSEVEATGIERAQLYEVIAIIGIKTITNYINHIAKTPIDAQFSG